MLTKLPQLDVGTSPRRARYRTVAWLLGLLCFTPHAPARAQDASELQPYSRAGFFTQFGAAKHGTRAVLVGLSWDWDWRWQTRLGLATGYSEFGLGRWKALSDGREHEWVTQIGLTPVLRWRPLAQRWFIEAGISVNLIVPVYENVAKRFGTEFNFGDHIAVGIPLDRQDRRELTLRLEHFSNGDIEMPNPGENFLQLRYRQRFG